MSAPQGAPPPAPLPGWLGPIVTITTQVGVPTVIAGVLLYFVLFRLDGMIRSIEKSEEDRVKIIAAMQDTLVATLDRQTKVFEDAIKENIAANRELWRDQRAEERRPYLPPMPGQRTPRAGDDERRTPP